MRTIPEAVQNLLDMPTLQQDDRVAVYDENGAQRIPGYVWAVEQRRYITVILFMGFIGEKRHILEIVDDDGVFFFRGQLVNVSHETLLPHEVRRIKCFRDVFDKVKAESIPVRGGGLLPVDVLDKEVSRVAQIDGNEESSRNGVWTKPPTYVEICSWFNDADKFHPERKPLAYFREIWNIFRYRSDHERANFLSLHSRVPSGFKKYFKSTRQAYQKAREFIESGRKNRFGYTVLAKDGHICNSLGEAKIDDYLFSRKVPHVKEPPYPGETNWRADFLVGDYYIEFFGLIGNLAYDRKTEEKIRYATELEIFLIEIYPTDLEDGSFEKKLEPAIFAAKG